MRTALQEPPSGLRWRWTSDSLPIVVRRTFVCGVGAHTEVPSKQARAARWCVRTFRYVHDRQQLCVPALGLCDQLHIAQHTRGVLRQAGRHGPVLIRKGCRSVVQEKRRCGVDGHADMAERGVAKLLSAGALQMQLGRAVKKFGGGFLDGAGRGLYAIAARRAAQLVDGGE